MAGEDASDRKRRAVNAALERALEADAEAPDEETGVTESFRATLDGIVALFQRRVAGESLADAEVAPEEPPPLPPEAEEEAEEPPHTDESPTPRETQPRAKTRPAGAVAPEPAEGPAQARTRMKRLYEDALWLFSVNDGEGALVSLERLLVLGRVEGEAAEFLRLNEERLLEVYERFLGSFERIPERGVSEDGEMPEAYFAYPRIGQVYELVDGRRSISAILEASPYDALETCAALDQLQRARVVRLPEAAQAEVGSP